MYSFLLAAYTTFLFLQTQLSKKDKLQDHISKILNTSLENVDVFTVMTSPSNSSFVDVRFSAHGSPYYAPEKLNNKATEQQEKVCSILIRFLMGLLQVALDRYMVK